MSKFEHVGDPDVTIRSHALQRFLRQMDHFLRGSLVRNRRYIKHYSHFYIIIILQRLRKSFILVLSLSLGGG